MAFHLSAPKSLYRVVILLIASILFAYIFIRAWFLSFTWDESYSFLEFVKPGIFFPDKYGPMSANNHLLNTWLMKLCYSLFGDSEISLRLPNVLAGGFYLLFAARISLSLSSGWQAICSFILLSVNPYLLDFFSLARGYGLSMGFLMGSLYFLFVYIEKDRKFSFLLMHLLFSSLSVLSNLIVLNFYFASGILLLLHFIFSTERQKTAKILLLATISFLLFLPVISFGLKLKNAGALFFGSQDGLWNATVLSLVSSLAYRMPYSAGMEMLIKGFIILTLILAFTLAVKRFRLKSESSPLPFSVFLLAIISFMVLSVILQNNIFDTLYPVNRTALIFVPVFVMIIVFMINGLNISNKLKILGSGAIALLCLVHYLACFNIYYVLEWKNNADIKEALKTINDDRIRQEKEKVYILTSYHFYPAIEYYIDSHKLNWISGHDELDPKMKREGDYYLLQTNDAENISVKFPEREVLGRYIETGNMLFRNAKQPGSGPTRLPAEN